MADVHDFKALAALGHDVHAAVVILLGHGDDFRGAANLRDRSLFSAHHAKGPVLFQAFPNHFFVARLENMQRQRSARKQYHIKRE